MTSVLADRYTGRALVSEELFERLTRQLATDEGYPLSLAVRVIDQALAFLAACGVHHHKPLAPSKTVDSGWHAFVLYTRDYREFCDRIAGRFIDHVPTDARSSASEKAAILQHTVNAIRANGYAVDTDLWFESEQADCTQCHNGCHDDPPPVRTT